MAGIGWIGLQSGKRGGGGGRLRIEKTKKYFSAFLFFFGGRKGISFVCAIVVCFCTFIAAFVKFVSLLLESCTTPCSPPFHERRCAAKTGPTQQHPHKIEGEKKKDYLVGFIDARYVLEGEPNKRRKQIFSRRKTILSGVG